MDAAIQYILYFAVLVVLAVPLGRFMAHIMDGEHTFLSPVIAPVERGVYRLLRIDAAEQMGCRRYLASVLVFSGIGLVALVALQAFQSFLPGNPQHLPGVSWDLSFNTAASFITNTNWQSYSGETTLSYLVQFMGLTVQNFVSAGTGIAVMFALIRGFRQVKEQGLGSFWVDLTRTVLYVLIPLNLVFGICLAAGGVISNFQPAQKAELVEPVAVQPNADGGWSVIDGAEIEGDTVKVDGKVVEGARVVTEQFLPQGPAAPQVAIKQSGTNGGGFFGVNSAHPYENPSAFTNIIEMTSLLLIPAACCFTFGIGVKNTKQGKAIFAAMFILLVIFAGIIALNEHAGTPQLADGGAVNIEMTDGQAGGNMEGKESRFGIASSSTWSAFTTAASNGSVNSMHDSYTPLGGFVQMLQMALGEVVFGGVGCGLYGMIASPSSQCSSPASWSDARLSSWARRSSRARCAGQLSCAWQLRLPFWCVRPSLHGARSCRPAQQWWRARLLRGAVCLHLMRRQQRLGVCRHELQHSLDQRHARPRDAVRPLHAHHRYAGYRRLAGQER